MCKPGRTKRERARLEHERRLAGARARTRLRREQRPAEARTRPGAPGRQTPGRPLHLEGAPAEAVRRRGGAGADATASRATVTDRHRRVSAWHVFPRSSADGVSPRMHRPQDADPCRTLAVSGRAAGRAPDRAPAKNKLSGSMLHGCGRRVQGRPSAADLRRMGAAADQLGPQAVALMVVLNTLELGLSHGKVARLLRQRFGLAVTTRQPSRAPCTARPSAAGPADLCRAVCDHSRQSCRRQSRRNGKSMGTGSGCGPFATPETTVFDA